MEQFESDSQSDAKLSGDYKHGVKTIESRAREYWRRENVYRTDLDVVGRKRRYVLGMFPYPSGNAHMGHILVYSIADALARMGRFKGEEVLNPLGWDAFGLPAENAAVKNNVHPALWTEKNIRKMRDEQIGTAGFSFDLAQEINTSSPEFYRWTQWLFLKLHEKGYVYRANSWVNWDPIDRTVLANEQVIDGKGWRSGAPIERREMEQWYIRITAFAEELWSGLDGLVNWSDRAISAQRNWIGRSEGVEIRFRVMGFQSDIVVFTTRPDTIYGVTSLTLAPEYPLLEKFTSPDRVECVRDYVREALLKSEVDRLADESKSGISIGCLAENLLTGERIPIYVSDYVIGSYGTGAIMNVPAHDQRDFEFARREQLPIRPVIVPAGAQIIPSPLEHAFEDEGVMINSGPFTNFSSADMRDRIVAHLEGCGIGKKVVRYRLRDWSVSRQRFWGCPIPMLRRPEDSWETVPDGQLPVMLPSDVDFSEGSGHSPLSMSPIFYNTSSPRDGMQVVREVDTLDTFMCSAWYVWRFLDAKNNDQAWRPKRADGWMPIDYYIGGLEHANQHMIYFRFMSHFLHSIGLTPTKEPVRCFLDNGMIRMHGSKMSKSRGNTVSPDDVIERYGADAVRLYILSDAPFTRDMDWDETGLSGKQRFLRNIWRLFNSASNVIPRIVLREQPDLSDNWCRTLVTILYEVAHSIEKDIDDRHAFHVAIAQLHSFSGELSSRLEGAETPDRRRVLSFVMQNYLKMLGLFAPHISEILWRDIFGGQGSLFCERWIPINHELLVDASEEIAVPVTVDGKRRAQIVVKRLSSDEDMRSAVEGSDVDAVRRHLEGRAVGRVVVVRDKDGCPKLLNVVTEKR